MNNLLIVVLLRDIIAFAEQLNPFKLTSLLRPYSFSPADLAKTKSLVDHSIGQGRTTTICVKYFDVLSYNVNNVAVHDDVRRRRVLHAIFSSGAHIVLLQETNPQWEVLLRKEGWYQYCYFHHPGCDERAAGGMAVLSQFPLEEQYTQVIDFAKEVSGSVFPALICGVNIPVMYQWDDSRISCGLTIFISNVHLRPPVNLDGTAWLDTARLTEPIRLREIHELINRTAAIEKPGGGRLALHIIAGDFNEGDNAKALAHLTNLGYIDALRKFVPWWKETHTWPFMRNLLLLRKRLDHILWYDGPVIGNLSNRRGEEVEFSVKLQCVGCGVMTGYEYDASDHQPVLSRFSLVGD